MGWRELLRDYADTALSLLYPPRCPICDRILPWGDERGICPDCERSVVFEREPRCMKCGRSLATDLDPSPSSHRVVCRDCEVHPHSYDYGFCLASYRSVARSLYRLKYRGRREYAAWYGREIAARLGREILAMRPEVLVPVPLHPARRAKRSYNQAEDVARALGKCLHVPVRADMVGRVVNTAPMKRADDEQKRRNNLKNAFQVRTNVVKYKRIVIVDDIYTSGSTVDAVARELRRAGVPEVYYVAVAASHL